MGDKCSVAAGTSLHDKPGKLHFEQNLKSWPEISAERRVTNRTDGVQFPGGTLSKAGPACSEPASHLAAAAWSP